MKKQSVKRVIKAWCVIDEHDGDLMIPIEYHRTPALPLAFKDKHIALTWGEKIVRCEITLTLKEKGRKL